MLSRRGKSLPRRKKLSFAGTGLLERMRSTTFALLGVTAAMGLGLVAVASQQDWPLLPAAPIPGLSEPGEVHEAAAVAGQGIASPAQRSLAPGVGEPSVDRGARTQEKAAPQVSGSQTLATAPPQPAPDPAADAPSDQGAPAAPGPVQPPLGSPTTAPAAEPSPTAPAPEATSSPKPPSAPVAVAVSSPKSDDREEGKAQGRSKSSGEWKGRPEKDDGYEQPESKAPPPPAAPAPVESDDKAEAEPGKEDSSSDRAKGRGNGHGRFGK